MRLAIALLFVATWRWCAAYDYSSTCARPHRGGRARAPPAPAHAPPHAPSPPCDLTAHTYCTTPGTGYPWHAIRRFVRENQGLMRRMYGEERHISVLKAELENFIEYDDADRRKSSEFAEDIIKAKLMYTKKSHARAIKDRPHFRPIQTSDKYKKFDNDTLKVKPLVNYVNNSNVNSTSNSTEITNNETMIDEKDVSYKTKLESIANIEINNLDPDVITLEAVIKQTIETNSIYPTFMGSSKSEPIRDESDYKNNTEGNATTTTEYAINATETTDVHYDDTTTDSIREGWKPMNVDTSTLPSTLLFSEHQKVKGDKTDTKATDKKEDFHPKPTQPDTVRPSVIKLRGANACESKEEMAAPFWANSTRGEVLALLNMYPFEQYIHLETCVHERKQMYCREGCRCEQQYRLHRLLAYDPRNECRGIFADWFKFPACCVCKCYDVPLEFRARSPRILHPQYDDEVKRVIYEDVARDWYSMSYDDEDDLY